MMFFFTEKYADGGQKEVVIDTELMANQYFGIKCSQYYRKSRTVTTTEALSGEMKLYNGLIAYWRDKPALTITWTTDLYEWCQKYQRSERDLSPKVAANARMGQTG